MRQIILSIMLLALSASCAYAAKPKTKPSKDEADSIAIAQRTEEIRDSLNLIMDKAKAGDAAAMNEVGSWYYTGKHVNQDYAQAYQWWKNAALKSDVRAIANLGLCYQFGHGVEADSIDALRLYEKSIKEGNTSLLSQRAGNADKSPFDAMLTGHCYEKGIGVKKDPAKAAEYFAKAADKGSVDGMRMAAMCYLNANRNALALPYFEKGASAGDSTCEFWAGKMLLGDMGVAPNKQQAVVYILKAAEQGMPAAENEMGDLYAAGNGVTKNLAQAAEWYQKAAIAGNVKGMWNYGNVLRQGAGVDKDYDMALFWMAEAAPNGYQRAFNRLVHELDSVGDPFADYVHGMRLYLVDGNMKAANEHFKKVEKAKVDEGKIMQAVVLASKRNDKPNAKKAAQSLEKLADANPEAAFYLASLYESGNGVPLNMAQAIDLYRKAADMGYGKAQCYLADIYYEGRGTEKDLLTAIALYQKALAAHQLSPSGYTRLAECYENGNGGLTPDKDKAASLRKHPATEGINSMLKNMK